ncbi:MAG TPA: SH3 domain-containing protein [Gammaproteobacteria bacterium]|nr:SH3 domain-containing protein [Gammaproteobacteria bacterium]
MRAIVFLILFMPVLAWPQILAYVSQDQGVDLLGAANANAEPLRRLMKSAVVEVLDNKPPGFLRVRSADGVEGWVPASLLAGSITTAGMMGIPAAPLGNTGALASGPSELAAMKVSAQSVATLPTIPAQVDRLALMESELKMLRDTNEGLKVHRDQQWFLAGAGTLLAGMVIGLIIPKIRWRRKSWHTF